jgi:hypothetical protein
MDWDGRIRGAEEPTMRIAVLVFALLCATTVLAKDRQWQEAKVTKVSSSVEDTGAVAATVGTTAVAGRIQTTAMYYWLETADITYIVAVTYTPLRSRLAQPNGGHPLNVTLNGKTKVAVDGANLHVLDDAGKDVKVPIALKIARTDQAAHDAPKQK